MTLRLPKQMMGEMIAHAYEDLPDECCGIIVGKDGVAEKLYRTRNSERSPYRYVIHPLDLKKIEEENDEAGWEVMVIYHSHVASRAYPSPTDIRMAKWPESDWDLFPNAHYVLVSLKDRRGPLVGAFTIRGGIVKRQRIDVVV